MVTALTIVVNLTAFILRPNEAFLVLLAWMLLGAIGVPVFVGGTSGAAKLIGPTGGFIVSFLAAAWVMSKILNGSNSFKKMVTVGILVGMPVIYVGGCISMKLVANIGLWKTLVMAVFPFIVGDIVKVVIAAFLATRLNKIIKD